MEKCKKENCEKEAKFFVHTENGVMRYCYEHYKEYGREQLEKINKLETVANE